MPRQSLKQRLEELDGIVADAKRSAYHEGRRDAEEKMQNQFSAAKLAQMQAAAKLMEEAGRIMSRAGYMIGKINNDNQR